MKTRPATSGSSCKNQWGILDSRSAKADRPALTSGRWVAGSGRWVALAATGSRAGSSRARLGEAGLLGPPALGRVFQRGVGDDRVARVDTAARSDQRVDAVEQRRFEPQL